MKIIQQKPQFKSFLDHYPLLVNGFLSELIENEEELKEILNPTYKHSEDACINEFKQIVSTHQKFMICGDFDCDGILSTSMLVYLFKSLSKEVGFYIPDRLTEGYGTSLEIVKKAHLKGYDCIVMLDNGVVNSQAHQYCIDNQLTLVVIDHHQIPGEVMCDCLIHPDVMDSYFEGLCSCGLVNTLIDAYNYQNDLTSVLAGIGTIGDMMVLKKQNRAMVIKSLDILNTKRIDVIESLLKKKVEWWDATTVAFQVVPVFNALGRLSDLGNVNNIVHYLLSDDPLLVSHISTQLKSINQQRKNMSNAQSELALSLVKDDDGFHVIHHQDFHPGIVGIIAGQISNAKNKPTMILTGDSILKGSVRANTLDVYDFLSQFKEDYFLSFGGHSSACALSIKVEDYPEFKQRVLTHINDVTLSEPVLEVLEFESSNLTKEGFLALSEFEPFGQGFKLKEIMFRAIVIDVRRLGQAGYLLKILPVGDISEVLYFKQDLIFEKGNFVVDVIGSLQLNRDQNLSCIASRVSLVSD